MGLRRNGVPRRTALLARAGGARDRRDPDRIHRANRGDEASSLAEHPCHPEETPSEEDDGEENGTASGQPACALTVVWLAIVLVAIGGWGVAGSWALKWMAQVELRS